MVINLHNIHCYRMEKSVSFSPRPSLFFKSKKLHTFTSHTVIISTIGFTGISNLFSTAPLTEGWWRVYSRWISQGLVPYRDFNLIVPPGMPYIDLFFSKIAGESFYNLRFIGLTIKCLIALLIFEILRSVINKNYALILSILGTILLYSTEVVVLFDYNYFAIFFLILSIYFWCISEEFQISRRKLCVFSFLSGVFLGFSFIVKLNFSFFLAFFYLVITTIRLFQKLRINRSTILLSLLWKFVGFLFPVLFVVLYFHSQNGLIPMLDSLFRESAGAKGNASSALTNWIFYLFDSYNYRKELATAIFTVTMYFGLEKYLLPRYFNEERQLYRIFKVDFKKKHARSFFIFVVILYIMSATLSLNHLVETGFENWWIVLSKQLAYLIIPHTFMIPVVFIFIMFFWALRKDNQKWIPLFTLCLTLIWGAGSSGGLNWYATSIPLVTLFAWVSTRTRYLEFFTAITLVSAIAITTTTYANWINSPYNWWGYRTPSVTSASVISDTGLTKGLRTDAQTLSTIKSIENSFQTVKDCQGGLLVFPHMPLFQLDLNSQPQRRDAIFWFDFVSQKNIRKAINEIEKNPPAGFAIVNVPKYVWEGHSKAFNGGKEFLQRELVSALLRESTKGYSSFRYRLYNNTDDWSINVYTRDSCELKK